MRHKAEKMGRNRGQGIIIGFPVFVIAVISICTIIFRSYVREFHKVTEKEKYDQYYVMITEDRKPDFWQSVYRGAYERGQAENVYVDLLGEHLSQEYSRSDLMRIAMTSGVDGILVESDESDEMSELIDEAVDRGIPVVTLYGDNTHSGELELPAYYDSSQQTIFVKKGLSEEVLFMSMAKEVSAAVYDFKYNESRDVSDFKSFCVAYMVSSRYGMDTRGFDFSRLPREYAEMDTQAFKGELGTMRDVLGEIQSDMYKSMEKNKPAKNKEQERLTGTYDPKRERFL